MLVALAVVLGTLALSLTPQTEILTVSALEDPDRGIKATSNFGTLQIDKGEYVLTSTSGATVNVNGSINSINQVGNKLAIVFTLADGTSTESDVAVKSDGTFQSSLSLNPNSPKGTYSVSATYAGTPIGAVTFTVKQELNSTSVITTDSQPVKPSQNPTINQTVNTAPASKLPNWVKSIFLWYGQGKVSEDELLGAIKYLVENGIIQLDLKTSSSNNSTPSNSNQPITSPNQNPTTETSPTITTPSSSSSGNSMLTNADIDALSSNPNQFNGQWAKFSGKILDVEAGGGQTAVQLALSEFEIGKSIAVYFNGDYSSQFVKDDCWIMEGKITGTVQGQNAFNALLTLPTMEGEKMTKTSCLEALYPSLKNSTVNISQQLGNVKITVNKVEFAEKHTRIFVTIQNLNPDRKVTFYPLSDAYIVQGQSQYSSQVAPLEVDTNGMDNTILPGIVMSGYIYFAPVPQNSFKLQLEADEETVSSDFNNPNFSIDQLHHKFTFDIPIQ